MADSVATRRLGHVYIEEARRRLAACHKRIIHCFNQLDDAQVWWRPKESMNSIANLVLHLSGNLDQWIVSGIGGAQHHRNRPLEFSERTTIPKEQLSQRLSSAVSRADEVLAQVNDAKLLAPRRIQGFEETVLSAIFESLAHFNGHTQEIVYITRLQLGDVYRFAWTPSTPEQIALRSNEDVLAGPTPHAASMTAVPVFLYDAFATSRFGGNVAGVVLLDDRRADDQWLQLVARELAAPTTGFVWRLGPTEHRVRFFTPRQEINMCGHVAVGVASALVDEGWVSSQSSAITLHTLAGPIPVAICRSAERPEIAMKQRAPIHENVAIESSEVAQILGIRVSDLHPLFPIEIVSTALRHLIFPVKDIAVLGCLKVDYAAVASLCRQTRCDTAPVVAFANGGKGPSWRLRDLCPAIGNNEEPASGTTNGALACYAVAHAIVESSNAASVEFIGEQGVEQCRPSAIRVRLVFAENRIAQVIVSGTAYRSFRGEVALDEAP